MTARQKLGIIQSRGLGDIVIALPIAHSYYQEGYDIYWPVCTEFVSHFVDSIPWVKWIAVETDNGSFFYDQPMRILREQGVDQALCLYQALTGHPEFSSRPEFQITKFDQVKYHAAGVPFINKWRLNECITRNVQREQQLIKLLQDGLDFDPDQPYVVLHLEGSDHRAEYDPAWIPDNMQIIEVDSLTDCVFDWLTVLEKAHAIVAVDSIVSNLVDQLKITETVDCYFIPRSHIHLTPVLGGSWTVLDPSPQVKKRIAIFKSG